MLERIEHTVNTPARGATRKKPYKKSTNGCSNCKSRRIKCGEERPACKNCIRRFLDATACCKYNALKDDGNSKAKLESVRPERLHLSQTSSVSSLQCKPSNLGTRNRDSILELRLFHHFHFTKFTTASKNPTNTLDICPLWEVDVPQVAFSSELVMDAMMAISALHLSTIGESPDQQLLNTSKSYLVRALGRHRSAVAKMEPHSVSFVMISGILIAHYMWLAPYCKDLRKEQHTIDLGTYRICQGLATIAAQDEKIGVEYGWPPPHLSAPVFNADRSNFFEACLEDLALLPAAFSDEAIGPEIREIYQETVLDLSRAYYVIATDREMRDSERVLCLFLHRAGPQFVSLLENEDPIAMALFARNMSMFSYIERTDEWWLFGTGKNKVGANAVRGVRTLMPPKYMWTLDWPLKVVEEAEGKASALNITRPASV